MKKIIFVANNNIGNGLSGGDRIFIDLIKNWSSKLDITLLGSEESIKIYIDRSDIKINTVKTTKREKNDNYNIINTIKHTVNRSLIGIRALKKNDRLIKKTNYIYSVSDFYPDLIPAFLSKLFNKKIIWIAGYYLFAPNPFSAESPYKDKNWLKGFLYWVMQRPSCLMVNYLADYVFVTSKPDVKKFITSKRDASKIIVVQGGVDITESEKYLQSQDIIPMERRKYDACFVGRFHYQKGVLILMDIWKLVCRSKPDAKLAMIGLGPLENDIKDKIKKYGLENNIDLLGFKDGKEKYEIFKQSKIMVHPATYDSGGMAAAEGMAWGLPGVSFDLEALKTYYPKGMVKTEQGNIKQFSENILKLLNDKNYYDKISRDAHALIVETWNWDKKSDIIYRKVF